MVDVQPSALAGEVSEQGFSGQLGFCLDSEQPQASLMVRPTPPLQFSGTLGFAFAFGLYHAQSRRLTGGMLFLGRVLWTSPFSSSNKARNLLES